MTPVMVMGLVAPRYGIRYSMRRKVKGLRKGRCG